VYQIPADDFALKGLNVHELLTKGHFGNVHLSVASFTFCKQAYSNVESY
jgi:hypothetical protein